jgi:hypothetical protein
MWAEFGSLGNVIMWALMFWKGETDGIKDGVNNCHKIMNPPFQKETQQKARNQN